MYRKFECVLVPKVRNTTERVALEKHINTQLPFTGSLPSKENTISNEIWSFCKHHFDIT